MPEASPPMPDDGSTQWSTRAMAARHGVGKDFVAQLWQARKIRPWRDDTFKLSADPDFEAKLVDIVGLYVDPPERAAVFSFDHKATDVLAFFKFLDAHVTRSLEIHVVLNNLSAHKAEPVQRWLNSPRPKRWHLHFTPTSSWLNLVERRPTAGH